MSSYNTETAAERFAGWAFVDHTAMTIITLVTLFLSPLFVTLDLNYSNGSRVGRVIKLSEKGLLCKTTEGELMLDGAVSVATEHGNAGVFGFTVKDKAVAQQIQNAMDHGDRVALKYHQLAWTSVCWGSTNYRIDEVNTENKEVVK